MTPWTLRAPDQFTAAPPPALTSARYTRDYREVLAYGAADSTVRSAFDTQTAQFWQSDPPVALWDRAADDLLMAHPNIGLTQTTRLLAQTNLAMADAVIAIWYGKNSYDRWRPVTAIQRADTDGNPETFADPNWTPVIVTPAFQDYPAAHPGVSESAAAVLAATFGNRASFTLVSGPLPTLTRSFTTFSAAVAQAIDARVFGGIHFRFSGQAAIPVGRDVARWVLATAMAPESSARHHR